MAEIETELTPETMDEIEEDLPQEVMADEVVALLCILQSVGKVPGNKKIWRRVVVPAGFSLLELHVCLQNSFDWENTHLHNFQQPISTVPFAVPGYSGFGTTEISKFPVLDVDTYKQADLRIFQSIIGIENASDGILTAAEDVREPSVYVQHSHPHDGAREGEKNLEFFSPPQQLLDERSFVVKDVLNSSSPAMVYEYDYGLSHQVTLLFQGLFPATEGVNYPICIAGQGASRAEDGNDMDDEGVILPSYNYEDFAVIDVLDNFLHTYEDSWPIGPGAESALSENRCYMCRYNRECGRRSKCTGTCCDYCLKSQIALNSGKLSIGEADALYSAASQKIVESRNAWVIDGKCEWLEEDGQPCFHCSEK